MVFLWFFYGLLNPQAPQVHHGIARSHAAGLGAPQRPFAGDAVQRVRLDAPLPRAGAATAGHGADGPLGPPRVVSRAGWLGWKMWDLWPKSAIYVN